MLTIFAVPKAFTGHSDRIQRNAITSWAKLQPACEIILLGKDAGIAEFAAEIGALHEPDIRCTPRGVPFLDSAFETAEKRAANPLLCFINADIILLPDFMEALLFVQSQGQPFMMTGQRWNTDFPAWIDFSRSDWAALAQARASSHGQLQPHAAMDYFAYSRGVIKEQPPMITGRGYSDNWMVYRALASGANVVDATPCVIDIHQNHDYSHITKIATSWNSEESQENRRLALKDMQRYYTLLDTTFVLRQSKSNHELIPSTARAQGRSMSLDERHHLLKRAIADAPKRNRRFHRKLMAQSFWNRAQKCWDKDRDLFHASSYALQAFLLNPGRFSLPRVLRAMQKNFLSTIRA